MAATSPKDKYLAVWMIFFMLGLGTLLPWNFFMTATMYFRNRLKDPLPTEVSANQSEAAGEHQSVLETKFNNVMTLCAMLPLLLCTCLTSFLHALCRSKGNSPSVTNDYELVAMTTPIMEVLERLLLAHLRKQDPLQSAYRHGDAIIHLLIKAAATWT
ncbi:equilibrative nucleoside transporter 1-like, partial [Poecilia reticulata]|uniref:equilibrative nucleoside transporter 1-like n=1 Tax=Poecilia reticulata TaxID=8081 RepID=UPI0004A4DEF4